MITLAHFLTVAAILFVVMMLDIDFATLRSGFTKNLPFGIIIAIILLAEIVLAVSAWKAGPALSGAAPREAVEPNIVSLGQVLYTRFLYPFEIAGLILLVAMIGAIVLTHRSRGDLRTPKVARQIDRRPDEAIKLENPTVGEGMKL